eukprot:symbB.v1.2.014518.t1/scaffold1064.1/size140376/4
MVALDGKRMVTKFAYLDQDSIVTCDPETNDQNSETNCKQLNGASAYFDGGLIEMKQVGKHFVASTRNNDFSNRSHKAVIIESMLQLIEERRQIKAQQRKDWAKKVAAYMPDEERTGDQDTDLAIPDVSSTFSTALEKPKDRFIHTPGRTHNRIRSPMFVASGL